MSLKDGFAQVPRSVHGSDSWAEAYGREMAALVKDYAARAPRSVQTHLGPSELGEECLTGDTQVVTRQGLRSIRELAEEKEAEILVPLLYSGFETRKSWGRFQWSPVQCYGEQDVFEIVLRRNQEHKTVRATANHNWFRWYYSGKQKKQEKLSTLDLRPGHRLTPLRRAMPRTTTMMHWAVAQGFVFGDGTKGSSDDRHRPASLHLYHNGKDEAMLKFFPGEWQVYKQADHAHSYSKITGLPRFWKELPPADESVSFLLSWLSGYFAADGSVGKNGQCAISSASREHLEFVQSTAAICGIGYGQIHSQLRVGISGNEPAAEATALYKVSLRRKDLPLWFFHGSEHARRVAELGEPRDSGSWTVESVRPAGRDQVYCATVEGIGAFALADDLMTGNCDRQVVMKMAGAALPRTNNVSDPWASVMGTAGHAYVEEMYRWDNVRRVSQGSYARWIPETRVTPDPGDDSHPGTADLYDAANRALVDHKFLGDSSRQKLISKGPKRVYYVQLLLYRRGFQQLGLPVDKIVLLAWPRTKSSLDELYVWTHTPTEEDEQLVDTVLFQTKERQKVAELVKSGHINIMDVPPTPSDDACHFCPLYRPQAAYDNRYGCPGTALLKKGAG